MFNLIKNKIELFADIIVNSRYFAIIIIAFLGFMVNIDYLTESFISGCNFIAGCCTADRIINLAIIKTLQIYPLFDFVDPLNRTEGIFYQWGFHWILAKIANLLSLNPLEIMNLVLVILPMLFAVALYLLFNLLTDNRIIALFATVAAFVFVPFSEYLDITPGFGVHAIIISFIEEFTGPYFDQISLAFGTAALIFLVRHIKYKRDTELIYFIFFASVGFLTHFLASLYIVTIYFFIVLFNDKNCDERRLFNIKYSYVVAGLFLIIVFSISQTYSGVVPLILLGGLAFLVYACTFVFGNSYTRKRQLVIILSLLPTLILIYFNMVSLDFNVGYNNRVRTIDLAIPFFEYVKNFAPILIGSFIYLILGNKSSLTYKVSLALIISSLVWVFNHYFAFNNHPYRFIPYSQPFITFVAFMGMIELWKLKNKYIRNILITILVMSFLVGAKNVDKIWKNRGGFVDKNSIHLYDNMNSIIEKVESIRKDEKDAYFYTDVSMYESSFLAILTGGKFISKASINFSNAYINYYHHIRGLLNNKDITFDEKKEKNVYVITYVVSKSNLENNKEIYRDKKYKILKMINIER